MALVSALTAVTVAAASYVVVRTVRLERETSAAVQQTQFNLAFAAEFLPPGATASEVEAVLRSLQRRGGFQTVIVAGAQSFQSSVSLGPAAVPADLADAAAAGRVVAARRLVGGGEHVVAGGTLQPDGPTLWFFYPLAGVHDDLRALAVALAASAAVMVLLSAVIGVVAARGLLRPIAQARDAARQLERGDLGARLDEEGTDEFAELSRSFNSMAAALERTVTELRVAEERQRRFVSDVSHELRTPVTALAAAGDVLEPRLDALQGTDRRAARILVNEAGRLRHLIEDLMEISRIDAGVAVVERDVVDLQRLLAGIAAQPWPSPVILEVQPISITADRRRLERVFTNLVDNAFRHGRPPVRVRGRELDGRAVIEVDDHGDGISPEHLPHLFERFYKADAARRRSSSSGLGLAIAHENVVLHGGALQVEAAPGGGARFRVTLPAVVADPLPAGEAAVTPPAEADVEPTASPKDANR